MFVLMVRELGLIEQFRYLGLVCELMQQSVRLGILKVNNGCLVNFWKESEVGYEISSFDSCE